jgi:prepilin-type N-terminal cleavage/methylation domain-containing protein
MMKKKTSNNRGFTLMEIIMSIVIISILGVIAGRGLMEIAKGYVLSRKNATVAQQGQIVMARLKKEISSIRSISCGNDKMITYTINNRRSPSDPENSKITTLYWSGSTNPLRIKTSVADSDCNTCTAQCTGGDILVENIVLPDDQQKQYLFRYCNKPMDCTVNYDSSNYTAATIAFVEVTLLLKGYEDTKIKIAYPDLVILNMEAGN